LIIKGTKRFESSHPDQDFWQLMLQELRMMELLFFRAANRKSKAYLVLALHSAAPSSKNAGKGLSAQLAGEVMAPGVRRSRLNVLPKIVATSQTVIRSAIHPLFGRITEEPLKTKNQPSSEVLRL
jgi:hypothetical protein